MQEWKDSVILYLSHKCYIVTKPATSSDIREVLQDLLDHSLWLKRKLNTYSNWLKEW
jgi:hypothetical protein